MGEVAGKVMVSFVVRRRRRTRTGGMVEVPPGDWSAQAKVLQPVDGTHKRQDLWG